jgi:hypothetical protein
MTDRRICKAWNLLFTTSLRVKELGVQISLEICLTCQNSRQTAGIAPVNKETLPKPMLDTVTSAVFRLLQPQLNNFLLRSLKFDSKDPLTNNEKRGNSPMRSLPNSIDLPDTAYC